jgi:thioredoxin 1
MRNYSTKEFKELLEKEGLVLVDFYATWCGPCKMMTPVLEELAETLKDDVTIAKIDVDQESDLASEYRISSIPTLVLLKNGKPVDSAIGYRDARFLAEMINKQK